MSLPENINLKSWKPFFAFDVVPSFKISFKSANTIFMHFIQKTSENINLRISLRSFPQKPQEEQRQESEKYSQSE